MYFRLPRWRRSFSFWFWGSREKFSRDGNYPVVRRGLNCHYYFSYVQCLLATSYRFNDGYPGQQWCWPCFHEWFRQHPGAGTSANISIWSTNKYIFNYHSISEGCEHKAGNTYICSYQPTWGDEFIKSADSDSSEGLYKMGFGIYAGPHFHKIDAELRFHKVGWQPGQILAWPLTLVHLSHFL